MKFTLLAASSTSRAPMLVLICLVVLVVIVACCCCIPLQLALMQVLTFVPCAGRDFLGQILHLHTWWPCTAPAVTSAGGVIINICICHTHHHYTVEVAIYNYMCLFICVHISKCASAQEKTLPVQVAVGDNHHMQVEYPMCRNKNNINSLRSSNFHFKGNSPCDMQSCAHYI